MSNLVIVFFGVSTLSALLSALFLYRLSNKASVKRFATGMLLTGVAFAVWSYAVITKPDDLLPPVDLGLAFLVVGLLFYVSAATASFSPRSQGMLWAAAIAYVIILWAVRSANPSNPGFSADGLFFFNPDPVVKVMEIILISVCAIPAAFAVARDLGKKLATTGSALVSSMLALVIGGILLLSSTESAVLYLTGWAMGVAFLTLLAASAGLFRKASLR